MSENIDPRLGASSFPPPSQYRELSQKPPAPPSASGARVDILKTETGAYGNSAQQSPQPYYYHYPTPQAHTPQQQQQQPRPGTTSTGSQSTQASPDAAVAYHIPADNEPSPENGDEQHGDDPKRPRACEACRGLKVRCDQDPAYPEIPCKRCAKAGRQCIITQPSRKRQKKADSRVAELEKKLDALTAALHQQQHGGATSYASPQGAAPSTDTMRGRDSSSTTLQLDNQGLTGTPTQAGSSSTDQAMPPQKRRRTEHEMLETPSHGNAESVINPELSRGRSLKSMTQTDEKLGNDFREIHSAWAPASDLKRYLYHTTPEEFVNRINSLINQDMAAMIFNRYVTKLAPNLPAVVFPPGTTAEQVFREKPILYVCILSASSFGTLHQDISMQIAREAIGAIADCVVRNGAKSLELIQAMQVTALWYKPPEQAEQTNFYQIIHMAAVMALDIGLGKRFNPAKARRGFGGPNAVFAPGPHKALPQDSDTLEARRAWLGCYYLCASASMVLRRPNLVRWTNYMNECIEVLETHPDAYPSDKVFCQHVKIQHICEEIGLQFLMDDNTANVSITDPKVTYALNVLENQLKTWKESVPAKCRGPHLTFFEHVTSLYLHEIALHFNHNIEDFRLPFTEESLRSVNNTSETLTQNQMAALEACLKAAHGVLDTMLGFDIQMIKSLPLLLFFVRCVYAIVILIKMHVAVCTPNSELGKMMKPEDLRVDYYMDGLIGLFALNAKETEVFRSQSKALRILGVLKEWLAKHNENVAALQRGETTQNGGQLQQQLKQDKNELYNQTPLHLLSQVATGDDQAQQEPLNAASQPQEWTFSSPSVMDYNKTPGPGHPDNRLPVHQQSQQPPVATMTSGQDSNISIPLDQNFNMIDPTNPEYGWGSGFEQAMDIALGGVDTLQGGGLDNWFLGEGMAPFAFNGDLAAGAAQWAI